MQMRQGGLLLALLGVLAIIFAFIAHSIGIGHSGFGTKHVILLVVGIILLAAGALIAMRSRRAV
jgi:LPXTG-motif cell wall-anchored protein